MKVKDQKNNIGIQKIVLIWLEIDKTCCLEESWEESVSSSHGPIKGDLFYIILFLSVFPVSIGVDGSGEFSCSSE